MRTLTLIFHRPSSFTEQVDTIITLDDIWGYDKVYYVV